MLSPALRYSKGLWSYNPIPRGCVLYLPLWALRGDKFRSVDSYQHVCDVTNATLVAAGRDFVTDAYIEVTTALLNYTSSDFSFVVRFIIDDLTATRYLLERGTFDATGYLLQVAANGTILFYTSQASANQVTDSPGSVISTATWYTIGVSRDGASVKIYLDGADVTDTAGTHTNPQTVSTTLKIGIAGDKSTGPLDGRIQTFGSWSHALSAEEQLYIHNCLRSIVL